MKTRLSAKRRQRGYTPRHGSSHRRLCRADVTRRERKERGREKRPASEVAGTHKIDGGKQQGSNCPPLHYGGRLLV